MISRDWNFGTWTTWAQPAVPLYLTLTLTPSFLPLKRLIGHPLFTSVIIFEEEIGTWVYRRDEAADLGQRMVDVLQVPSHRSGFEDELAASTVGLLAAIAKTESTRCDTSEECVALFGSLELAFTRFYTLGAFVEPVQEFAQRHFSTLLAKNAQDLIDSLSVSSLDDVEAALYAIREESFVTAIRMSAANVANLISTSAATSPALAAAIDAYRAGSTSELDRLIARREMPPELLRAVNEHLESYHWSTNNYARCTALTASSLMHSILNFGPSPGESMYAELSSLGANRERQLALKRDLVRSLSPYDTNLLSIHDLIGGHLLDIRKRLVMQSNAAFTTVLNQIAGFVDLGTDDLLYLLPQEIARLPRGVDRYVDRISSRRESMLVYQSDFSVLDEEVVPASGHADAEATGTRLLEAGVMSSPYVAEGRRAVEELLANLSIRLDLLEEEPGSRPISGTPVYFDRTSPVMRGKVRVVRDPRTESVRPGEILVAMSTTPDFIDAIHHCSAIVTDWGGQTSHAAITARELSKPCIIGTKFASLVLRTGDVVELDFGSGSIRSIET
jgi:phosphohistidine swiveling domain-containing protein